SPRGSWSWRAPRGQRQPPARAALGWHQIEFAPLRLGEATADDEPEARAVRALRGGERVEETRLGLGREPGTVVLDFDAGTGVERERPDGRVPALLHRLDGVLHQL